LLMSDKSPDLFLTRGIITNCINPEGRKPKLINILNNKAR